MENKTVDIYGQQIELTKEQESCIRYTGNRTLLVKGAAGSGKSLVIENLARKYVSEYSSNKNNRVAIFTFNNTLAAATQELYDANGEKKDFITITTLARYLIDCYIAIGGPRIKIYNGFLQKKIRTESLQEAFRLHASLKGRHRFHDLPIDFWLEEIDWMKNMNVSVDNKSYYLSLKRRGRGGQVRMNAADRETAYSIFCLYEGVEKRKNHGDWIDYTLFLIRHPERIPEKLKFDHVLVDEAQDLSLAQMVAAMMFFRKGMVLAMDMNQRIYKNHWTPKQLGIETTTKKLTKSMRTTRQIDALAESLRCHNDAFLNEEDKMIRVIPDRDGPKPLIIHAKDTAQEKEVLIDQIKQFQKIIPNHSIGILAAKNSDVQILSSWLTDYGISFEVVAKDSTFSLANTGVKICNVHNAKGLEFGGVIIPRFYEGNYPSRFYSQDDEIMQAFLIQARNLAYVAMTRARLYLTLIFTGRPSRFLSEMDPACYELSSLADKSGSYLKKATQNAIAQNAPSNSSKSSQLKEMFIFLKDRGMDVIDKTENGGNITVKGKREDIESVVSEAEKKFKMKGRYSEKLKAAGYGPGWWIH